MNRLRRRVLLATGTVLALGVFVAAAAASELAAGPLTVEIRIHHSRFIPATAVVPPGRPVRFVFRNEDPIDHEWIVGDEAVHAGHRTGTEPHHAERPTEVSIPPLTTMTTLVTFPAAAELTFVCHLPGHEAYGMVGTLSVR